MNTNKLVFLLSFLLILSCESKKENANISSDQMVGDWNVQWVTYPEQGNELDGSINYTMNGMMNIKSDGKITINAYGYEGCIFGGDTLIHTLNWEIKSDTILNLTNDGDKFGIPYYIKEASENKVKLQLVQDVYLFLTK